MATTSGVETLAASLRTYPTLWKRASPQQRAGDERVALYRTGLTPSTPPRRPRSVAAAAFTRVMARPPPHAQTGCDEPDRRERPRGGDGRGARDGGDRLLAGRPRPHAGRGPGR